MWYNGNRSGKHNVIGMNIMSLMMINVCFSTRKKKTAMIKLMGQAVNNQSRMVWAPSEY